MNQVREDQCAKYMFGMVMKIKMFYNFEEQLGR